MGFGILKTKNSKQNIELVEPSQSKERTHYKYIKETTKDKYPQFLNDKVTYDDGIWKFDALNIEFDEDTRIITKYDVKISDGSVIKDLEIQLRQTYQVKRKADRELFSKYINTTDLKDSKLLREMKRYIQKNRPQTTIESKIHYLVEIKRVKATENELVQDVKTLLFNAGLKWTGKRHVLPLSNNICKPVDNNDLLNFIIDLTEITALSQETLDKALKYFTMETEPVKHCIVTKNGYYDFNVPKFFTESKEEIIIDKNTPYSYREELIGVEPPDKLKEFLIQIFKKNDESYSDLEDDITALLELIGYMLDDGNRFQILIVFIGASNCGKGLTMRLVNYLLDGRVCDVDIFKGRAIGKELNALVENDLNVIHEFKTTGKNDINFFKQVTGGDNIQISKLYAEPKTYTHNEYAKSVLTANDVNDLIKDADNATLRRLSTFIKFKNVPEEIIDDLDEQIRDEPDAMDWLLTNSIEAYANVLRNDCGFKAKHTNEETLDMLTEFDNPVLKELESTYYYDYESWEYDNDFVKENGVRPKDIKNRFGLKYPKLNSNKSFGKIIRDAFDLDKKEGESDAGYYVTKQFTVDGATETYIVGLHKRQLKNS